MPQFGPPPGQDVDKYKDPKPGSLKEVPSFLKTMIVHFFSRLTYIFKLVWETRPWILFALFFIAILKGVLPVVQSLIGAGILNLLAEVYSSVKNGLTVDFNDAVVLLILQFAVIFVSHIINTAETMISRISGELVVNHVNVKMMVKAKTVDIASFDRPDFYERLENASREAGSRPIQILKSTFSIVSIIISIVSFIAILWRVSPFAPFIMLIVSIPSAVISFTYRKKNFNYIRKKSRDRRELSYYSGLTTNKDMVKEVRIFGLSDFFIERYQQIFKRYFGGLRRLFMSEGLWEIIIAIISAAVNCGMFLFIAHGVYSGTMMVGDFSLYTGALTSIAGGVASLIGTMSAIYEGTLFIDNLITYLNEKQTVVPALKEPLKPKKGVAHKIELRNVSFRYPGSDHDVIKNFSVTLEPGSTVVLVGLNGAGKTTLIKLITRLYDPTEGEILLDGVNIKNYDIESLYSLYGIIFQDFGKYAVSVKENIAFSEIGRPIVDDEITAAAKESDAETFIGRLPQQYDTPLMRIFDESGTELSIGQWQKLSIARAFYSHSDILILDEPTASLDAIAEQEVYNQFDNLRKEKTTIFVSHRLSSATVADDILVVENGELIEHGNHKQLMELGGKYYELFSTQASRYMSENNDKKGGEE